MNLRRIQIATLFIIILSLPVFAQQGGGGGGGTGGGGGSGTVNAGGAANQLAYYPAASAAVSGKSWPDLDSLQFALGGGTAQAQTVTLSPPATALTPGLELNFLPAAANSGAAPTLSVNGLTATPITKLGTTPLVANDLTTTAIASVIYDGTQFQLQNPQTSSSPVVSVSNADGTLTISPTTGLVVASLALGHANTWSALQTFGANASIAGTAHGILLSENTSAVVATAVGATNQVLNGSTGADPTWGAVPTGAESATVVQTGQTNVYTTGLQDFTSATMEIPEAAGFTAGVNSTIGLDATANIVHILTNGADSSICAATATDTTTTHAVFATAVAGICNARAIATGDLPTSGIPNVAYLNAGNVYTSAGTGDFRSASATAGLAVPVASGAAPLASGFLAFDSNINVFSVGNNGTRTNLAVAGIGAGGATTCTNQVVTVISAAAAPTCTTLGTSFGVLMNNVLNTGTAGFQIDGSASTAGNPFKTQSKAGATATAAGAYTYDSTTGLFHLATNAVDASAITAPARVSATAQTAAIGTTTLCTAAQCPANPGHYEVHWEFTGGGTACSSVSAGSVAFNLTWTDENAVAHAAVALQMMAQTGAATTAMGGTFPFQTALANEGASGTFSFSTNGTIIQYSTTYIACTTGTGTYSLRAEVTRMQ